MTLSCASCGAALAAGQKFCGACGTPVASRAAGADLSQAERKMVTALFADIKGFTALSEDMDPEEVRNVVDPAIELMMQAVHRYEGFVAQSLGDGIFALFGAPVAHEDHAQRALHAALAMQDGIRQRSRQGPPLEVRIGINTGEVVVRSMRKDDTHSDYIPIGHSINLASRLENLATPGTIRISEDTFRLTEDYFNFRDLGTVTVKGVREPVRTYEVLGLGTVRTRLERSERRGLIGFVGREAELERMAGALERVRAGEGGIVAVMGEPGLGKSRLCYEFARAHLADALLLKTFSVSHGKANAYQALISLLQQYFGWRLEDDASARRRRVTEVLAALDPALAETLPYLFHLLGIAEPGVSLAQMDPEIRRTRTFQAIEQILRRVASRQALILLCEDLQWADRETLAFLAGLSRDLRRDRILVLVNYRPEYTDYFWAGQCACAELRLMPLAQAGSTQLLTALLGGAAEMLPLKQRIAEQSGGNPFFMEEIARGLLEQGIVRREAERYVLTRPAVEIEIPADVQGVIAARIDRLPAEAKALLQTVAVIGKEITVGLVQQVSGLAEAAVRTLLEQLVETGFALPLTSSARYEIKHGLIQEVAYRLLLKERRRALHEECAQALERLYSASLAEHYVELAHHYYNSGNGAKAIEYLALAGQQAAQRSANEEAVIQLRRALELLEKLPPSPQRDARELGLQLAIGAPLMRSKGWADAEVGRSRARALELAEPLRESPQMFPALFGLWGYSLVRADIRTAHKLAVQVSALADKTGDAGLQVEACRVLAPTLYFLGELAQSRATLERGVALYDGKQHGSHAALFGQDPRVTCLSYASVVLWLLGFADEAQRQSAEALRVAQELAHPYTLGFALFFAGTQHHQRRDAAQTLELAEAAIALCTEHGFPLWRAGATTLRGWALAQAGACDEGIEEMRRGMQDWRATGAEVTRPYFLAMLGEGCLKAGRPDEALAAINEGLALAEANSDLWWQADLYRLQSEARAEPAAARASLQYALKAARRQGALSLELRAANALLKHARDTGTRELLREVRGRFSQGLDSPDMREAAELLAD